MKRQGLEQAENLLGCRRSRHSTAFQALGCLSRRSFSIHRCLERCTASDRAKHNDVSSILLLSDTRRSENVSKWVHQGCPYECGLVVHMKK